MIKSSRVLDPIKIIMYFIFIGSFCVLRSFSCVWLRDDDDDDDQDEKMCTIKEEEKKFVRGGGEIWVEVSCIGSSPPRGVQKV